MNISGLKNPTIAIAIFIGLCAPLNAHAQPPPPPAYHEFLGRTFLTHQQNAQCNGSTLAISWQYTGRDAEVTSLIHNGREGAAGEISQINEWLSGIGGDVFILVACGSAGANLVFTQSSNPTTSPRKLIWVDWIDGKATLKLKRGFQ